MIIGWLYLGFAILLEVFGTIALKMSEGLTRAYPMMFTTLCYVLSVVAFAYALKKLDVGTAYAIWSGIGTLMIASIGVLYFQESLTLVKAMSLGLIILGVVGLNLQSS